MRDTKQEKSGLAAEAERNILRCGQGSKKPWMGCRVWREGLLPLLSGFRDKKAEALVLLAEKQQTPVTGAFYYHATKSLLDF